MHPLPARNARLEPEGVSLSPRVGTVNRQRPLRAQTVSVSEPPALVLNEPGYYRVRIHDPRLPLRSGNSWRGGLLLPLSRQNRLHVRLPDRLRPELDLQPVDGVIGSDLAEDHLQDALLLLIGHDRPVVDDGLQALTLERDRGGRRLGLELVAFDEQVILAVAVLGLSEVAKLV